MLVKILNLSVCFLCFTLGLFVNTSILLMNDMLTYKQKIFSRSHMIFTNKVSSVTYHPVKLADNKFPQSVVFPSKNQVYTDGKGEIRQVNQENCYIGNRLIVVEQKPRTINATEFNLNR